jgi:HlyD family secretion protein
MRLQPEIRIGVIEKLDPIMIRTMLNEEAAAMVRSKSELAYAVGDSAFTNKAQISYLASIVDPQMQAYELTLELANPNLGLKPGTAVTLQLMEESEQLVIAIPTHAVISEDEERFVYVVKEGITEKRKVQLGRVNGSLREILSGVQEGETLVVSGQTQLEDKEKVVVETSELPTEQGGQK